MLSVMQVSVGDPMDFTLIRAAVMEHMGLGIMAGVSVAHLSALVRSLTVPPA